ncbi:MAG: hypothetical protein IJV28_02840 [Paludibacteraceae bacterium]|nr:hypothetical protein [Paludibacteraceae bacterium]
MKKILSLLCAVAIVFSASAAPQLSKKELDEKAAIELLNTKKLSVKHAKKSFEQFRTQKFEGAKLLNKVEVARAPKAKKDVTFDIAVSDITASAATIAVTPSDASASYYWTYVEASETSGKSDAELVALLTGDMDYMIMLYTYFYGMEVTYADLLIQGADSSPVSGLSPETSYTVVAAQLDDEGNLIGAVATASFTTLELILPEGGDYVAVSASEKFYSTDNDVWVKMADADGNQFNFDIVVADGQQALVSGQTYGLDDMIEDYSYATVSGAKIPYASASLTKTVQANGDYSIAASFVDTLGNTWNISYSYVKPVKNREEAITITNGKLVIYPEDGDWQVMGFNADSSRYVSIDIVGDLASGSFDEEDMNAQYTYIGNVVLGDEGRELSEQFNPLSFNISVTFNAADSTATITGTYLGQGYYDATDIPEFTLNISASVSTYQAPVGNEYDSEEDFIVDFDVYEVDNSNQPNYNVLFVFADNAAERQTIVLELWLPEGQTDLVAGEYYATEEEGVPGSVTFGVLSNNRIYGSYAANYDEEEYIIVPLWFIAGGKVTVNSDLSIDVDALNSKGAAIKCHLAKRAQGIDNIDAAVKATKVVRDGQLLIIKNGVEYNAQGTILK